MLFALVVDDTLGWLPNYLRAFVLISAFAGAVMVVNLRALEPLSPGWRLATLLGGALGIVISLPGMWLCVRAEDVPLGFIGPFVIVACAGAFLLNAAAGEGSEA